MRSWDRASSRFVIYIIFFRSSVRVATSSSLRVVIKLLIEQIVTLLSRSLRTSVVCRCSEWSLHKLSTVGIFRPRIVYSSYSEVDKLLFSFTQLAGSLLNACAWLFYLDRYITRSTYPNANRTA